MLHILSHSTDPRKVEWWKHVITRRILGRQRGPDAVRASLLRGLTSLHLPYRYQTRTLADTVLVLSGIEALKEAVAAKQAGRITKLIAGPNVTIHPYDHDRLLCNPAIDTILVPSPWTRDYWAAAAPEIATRLAVWPAGVAQASASTRAGKPIIYNKLKDETLLREVLTALETDVVVFHYNHFSHTRYLEALASAPYLIYLAESESQGLALQEAWAHDVPTLVNENSTWQHGRHSWSAPQINAPYLNAELGRIFPHVSELPTLLSQVEHLHPKNYCDRELSDEATTRKLLERI